MTPSPWTLPPPTLESGTRWRRVVRHPIARMLAASLAICMALAPSFALTEGQQPKDTRVACPNLVAARACVLGYWVYASRVERRQRHVTEMSTSSALP